MKKITVKLITAIIIIVGATSCLPIEEQEFDGSLLPGKWQSGTLYERYFSDGTGYTWDTADDVNESEAQHFTWTLEKSMLTQYHQMEMGPVVPMVYTVTKLTTTSFSYKDNYFNYYSFTKVN